MSRALKTPRDWLTGWSAATWQQCIVCLRFSPFRATFAQRGHRRRELPRLADDMTAISEGMKPCVHVRVRLFCRYFGNRPKNLTYVLGYVKLLDRARGKSAHCDTEVRDRFGHVFCEVTGDLTAGDLLGVALSPGAADDDLDVDLFAEPDGYVAGQRQDSGSRRLANEDNEVVRTDARVGRCRRLTGPRCGVQTDDGVEVGERSAL